MKKIRNTVYRDTWVPDHCDDSGLKIWNADNWQDGIVRKVVKFISNNGVGIDVGACIGMTSISMCRYFDKVVAFEPDPLNYECLVKNTSFLENIITSQYALYNENFLEVEMSRIKGSCGLSFFFQKYHTLKDSFEIFNASTVTLDSYRESNLSKVDFLKIDVEGVQMGVLQGSVSTLQEDRPVVLIEIPKSSFLSFTLLNNFMVHYRYIFLDKFNRDFLFIPIEHSNNISKHI